MNFKEIQSKAIETVQRRLNKKEIKPSIDLTISHLIEEIGEIASQINNGKLKRGTVDTNNIGEEISDSIILLMLLAEQYNIDLEKALLSKMGEIDNKNLK